MRDEQERPRRSRGAPPGTRGRGAARNVPGRFATRWSEPLEEQAEDDLPGRAAIDGTDVRGLDPESDGVDAHAATSAFGLPPDPSDRPARRGPPTVVTPEASRTVISRNDSPDVPFSQSLNPYKGCEHGCFYCFARPTHAYLDLSPGLDFETKIFSKPRAAELLRAELSHPRYRCRTLVLGANTDAYQPVERRLGITRGVLEVLREFRHPVSLLTKSDLILRDADILEEMAANGLASVFVSVTTLDPKLAGKMEPRASMPARRLRALSRLAARGIPCGVLASPMIPGINDTELEAILAAAATSGATLAGYILVRLPHELKPLFSDWLEQHFPDRALKVLHRIEQMRGGRWNDPRFGSRMRGEGPLADLLERRFVIACRRHGLDRPRPELDTSRFRVPPGPGHQSRLRF